MAQHSKSALILGGSGGIGAALVDALLHRDDFIDVIALSRAKTGFDITDDATVQHAATALAAKSLRFDLIVNACGVLEIDGVGPEKSFRDLNPETMEKAFRVNAVGAALALKHFGPLLKKERGAVFATLSARVGSISDNRLGGWMSYRASKAALNQLVRCAAVEFQRTNKNSIIVAIHPGTVDTKLTQKYARGRFTATPAECALQILAVSDDLTEDDTGLFLDYAGQEIAW